MFKLWRFSTKKSKILKKIARIHKPKNYRGDVTAAMDNAINARVNGPRLIEDLLNLLSEDTATKNLLLKYNRTFDDIRSIISVLEKAGGDQVIRGHYIPVSSVSFLDTLNLLLQVWDGEGFIIDGHSDEDSRNLIMNKMLESF